MIELIILGSETTYAVVGTFFGDFHVGADEFMVMDAGCHKCVLPHMDREGFGSCARNGVLAFFLCALLHAVLYKSDHFQIKHILLHADLKCV
jgi:hypothetical protein